MSMELLSAMPNIGKELAKKLSLSEISSPDELKFLGSKEAFLKIKTIYPKDACINMLYALEGAIQGVRWHKLDEGIKAELLDFYRNL